MANTWQIRIRSQSLESGDTILAADGSSSAPGISFASDTNTGIYKVSNDKIAFVAGGNVGMTHTLQSGLFGITSIDTDFFSIVTSVSWGVQAPDVRLFNVSTTTGAKLLLFEGSSNGSNSIGFKVDDSISSTVLFNLPGADGSADKILKTDGSGNLDWVANDDKLIQIDWVHEAPSNVSYVVCLNLPDRGGTLEDIYYKSDGGTCTADITTDGTSVTSWSALSVSSTEGNTASTGNETFSGGETLRVVITSASSADMVSLSIKGTFD